MADLPTGADRRHDALAKKVFQQIKDHFLLQLTAIMLCRTEPDRDERVLTTIIDQYLKVEFQAKQLTPNVKFFFSVIINKKNWTYLQTLLQSPEIMHLDPEWAQSMTNLLSLSQAIEESKSLRLCHQVQWTIHTNNQLSIFPQLHQPYHELNQCVHQCSQKNDPAQRWAPLINWIQSKLNARPPFPTVIEIKVMLLLNVYYNYYCINRLDSLDGLLPVLEHHLQATTEEMIVFRAFLKPAQFMVGYDTTADNTNQNYLNDLFRLDFTENEGLAIRHVLVNLLAMILLAGKESFLWVFVFQPLKLTNTFGKPRSLMATEISSDIISVLGFGSLRQEPVSVRAHYDCGCVLTETGAIVIPPNGRSSGSCLEIPAVYVAYFATFGALVSSIRLISSHYFKRYLGLASPSLHRFGQQSVSSDPCKACHRAQSTWASHLEFWSSSPCRSFRFQPHRFNEILS